MRHPIRSVLVLALPLAALAACAESADTSGLEKQVADLRADLQKTRTEKEKLEKQIEAQARRIDGLAQDVSNVRGRAMDVQLASSKGEAHAATPADGDPAAPAAAPSAGATAPEGGAVLSPQAVGVRDYLATEDGKKTLQTAIDADREARNREQQKRQIDGMIDRFAKTAQLTEDQTKRMKEIMGSAQAARTDMWSSIRELGPDATPEQRTEAREAMVAKTDELRKQTDDQVKAVLSSTQYEQYQQEQDKLRAGLRGFGGGGRGDKAGGRAGRTNGN
jgi:chromosome segregation ATPase